MNADRQFLRAGDIAAMLGVTTGRVYQLIAAGEIPEARTARHTSCRKRLSTVVLPQRFSGLARSNRGAIWKRSMQ